jgi:hypothetical protein
MIDKKYLCDIKVKHERRKFFLTDLMISHMMFISR